MPRGPAKSAKPPRPDAHSPRDWTEQALRASEAKLRALLRAIPDLMFRLDRNGVFLQVMSQRQEDLALPPDQFLGRRIDLVLPPEVSNQAIHHIAEALATRQTQYYEYDLLLRGENRSFEARMVPSGDDEVLAIVRDVTDRKRAEAALREARDRLEARVAERTAELAAANDQLRREIAERRRAQERDRFQTGVLAQVSDAVVAMDMEGRLTYWNPAAERLYGLTADQAIGRSAREVFRYELLGDTEDGARAALLRTGTWRGEARHPVASGEIIQVESAVTLLRDAAGQPAGALAVVRDVTARKQAEQALRESERQFKEAAEFNKRLLQEVDHRVGNNLAGLLSLVAAMRDKTADVSSFAAAIEARLAAMAHIHRLLGEHRWSEVDLRELVESTLGVVAKLARHPVPVTARGPAVPVAARDALPLAMVLLEWCTNSCKYGAHTSPAGRVDVTWHTESSSAAAYQTVRLRWKESGGPPVHAPEAESLGTNLVRSFATVELRGRCELTFPATGAEHFLEFHARDPRTYDAASRPRPLPP